jgi:murein DD-endopeptidase MepM/ murein hydrolase activator NlpD
MDFDALLKYKSEVNSLQDVPARTVRDLSVKHTQGKPVTVKTQGGPSGSKAAVGHGKIIGTPHQGTHTLGNWQSDNAVDVAMPVGSKLRAPRDAVVEKVGGSYSGGAGRFDGYQVTVRLANGDRLFYTHLSRPSVKSGQRLRAGQVIGRSGAANGVPHLHLGAERGNPKKYVR